jgi:hypothetical protein
VNLAILTDKSISSVVAPGTLRALLADPRCATHRLNPSSSGTGREEDHSVCLNLKSSSGRSTNPSIPRSEFLPRRLSQDFNRRSHQMRLPARHSFRQAIFEMGNSEVWKSALPPRTDNLRMTALPEAVAAARSAFDRVPEFSA